MKRMAKRMARTVMIVLTLVCSAGEAAAVVGAPLTPVSYAGVARRTARRTAVRQEALHSSYVTTLPGGCAGVTTGGVVYQRCGGVYYRPYYDGPNLVYVVSTP